MQTTQADVLDPEAGLGERQVELRSPPLPPMPVSKRTMPSPARDRPGVAVRDPRPGQGSRSRQIPGRIRSVRGASLVACPPSRQSSQSPPCPRYGAARTPASTPATAKQRAPVRVPQLAIPTAIMSPSARTKEATAETMKRTEPTWLTTTIHQPRLARGAAAAPGAADLDHRQVAGDQEEGAADDVRLPDQAVLLGGVRSPSNESTRLIAKTRVPTKRTTALEPVEAAGSRAHQRQARGREAAVARAGAGALIASSTEA